MAQFIVQSLEDENSIKVRLTPRAARLAGWTGSGAYPPCNAACSTGGMITMAEPS
jgi:hypothetical protein